MKNMDNSQTPQPTNSRQDDEVVTTRTDDPRTQEPTVVRRVSRRRQRVIISIVLVLLAGIIGAALYAWYAPKNTTITSRSTVTNDGNKIVTQEEEDVASVVAKVSPSVVSVVTSSQSTSFYGQSATQEGAGTGIVVSKDGYILTNKHVIDGTSTVGVVLADGTTYSDVKVLGTDPLNDIAFLKIANVDNLSPAELGDSTSVRVGQKVIAIGNSLGQYQNTVTSGIISGTGRPISAQAESGVENLTDLIQTDAAINPGNSGGPLLNLKGQVVGINTAIIQDAQGIGFSIPIGSTKGILKGVLAGKGVQRPYLGINYIPITADVASHYKLSVKKGAYVYNGDNTAAVVSGSPAASAGIKDKDIITKVGDIEVGDRGSVSSLVAEYAPGDTIQLTLLRGGQTMTVNVTLSAYKS
jgi:serine protease Do